MLCYVLFIWLALLEAYDGLSQLASDEALKNFLSVIHDNYDKVGDLSCSMHGLYDHISSCYI